jgi:hypothetical protein
MVLVSNESFSVIRLSVSNSHGMEQIPCLRIEINLFMSIISL